MRLGEPTKSRRTCISEADAKYESDHDYEEYRKLYNELGRSMDFDLAEPPMLPPDLVWYHHRNEWKQECQSRLAGRRRHSEFTISTSEEELASESERKKIEADLKILLFSASGDAEKKQSEILKKKQIHTCKVIVDFYPLADYQEKTVSNPAPQLELPAKKRNPQSKLNVTWVLGGAVLLLMAVILGLLLL